MDKKKSVLNISVSIGFKVLTMCLVVLVKRMLIRVCGNEVNGLNALYLSVVGFLSVAELGVGSAITFCMYKPIVEGDNRKVSALYGLFQRLYRIIGGVILVAGLVLAPFIHLLAADYVHLDVNLHATFVLMLVSVVLSYFYGAKTSLFNAYKNNYITTAITSGGIVLQYLLQIVALKVTGSFSWYLACRILSVAVQWAITEVVARKKYSGILSHREKLDADTRKGLTKNIRAMFMHKVGELLVNTVDGIIISAFVGVIALGKYSNYSTIMVSMTSVINLLFSSLTSVWGHLYVQQTKETVRKYFNMFHLLNFLIGVVFYLGYYSIVDNLIAILFSDDLVVENAVPFVITLNGFVQFMRISALTFRNATGTFYYDRWKPLVEGVFNVVLSVIFVKMIGVVGVIAATVITNLVICHVIEPYVLYRFAFESTSVGYFVKNYSMIFLFVAALLFLDRCMQDCVGQWQELLINGCISVVISALICCVVFFLNKETREHVIRKIKESKKA